MILSVCAALITINDNSRYFMVFFSGEVEVVSCSYIAGMLLCFVALSAISYVRVLCCVG